MIDTAAMPTVEGTFAMRSLEGSMDYSCERQPTGRYPGNVGHSPG